MKSHLVLVVVSVIFIVYGGKVNKKEGRREGLWKKKQAAIEARTDFNKLWDTTLGIVLSIWLR